MTMTNLNRIFCSVLIAFSLNANSQTYQYSDNLYEYLTTGQLNEDFESPRTQNDLQIINSITATVKKEGYSGDELLNPNIGIGYLQTKQEIGWILEDANETNTMVEKLNYLLEGVEDIRSLSGGNFFELLPRMVLNRCEELVQITAPLSTKSKYYTKVQMFYVNFLDQCYLTADNYLEYRQRLVNSSFFSEEDLKFVDEYSVMNQMKFPDYEDLQIIDYAVRTAKMMFDYTNTTDLTESAQSVMMVKILQNLARDIQDDIRAHRDPRIISILRAISKIQHRNRGFKMVLNLVKNNVGPDDIDWQEATGILRAKIDTLFRSRLNPLVLELNQEKVKL